MSSGGHRTLIHRAVEEDDVELLQCLLESSPGISVFCGNIKATDAGDKHKLRSVLGLSLRGNNSAACTELLIDDLGVALSGSLEDHEAVRESVDTESLSLQETLALCRVFPELFLQAMRILKPRKIDGRRIRRVMPDRHPWILGSEEVRPTGPQQHFFVSPATPPAMRPPPPLTT